MATFRQYTKKDGSKAWMFKAYLGTDPSTGKQVQTTRRNFETKKIAQKKLNELLVDYEKNGLKKQNITTFQEVYDLWYTSYKNTVKESTSIATERYMKLHILPVFGKSRIDKITLKQCQKAVNDWAEKLQVFKVVLQYAIKVMDYAINLEIIDSNPFKKVIRPVRKETAEQKKIKFYTAEELESVMVYLKTNVNKYKDGTLLQKFFAEYEYTLYRLLAFTGLRGGEAAALTWDDIDFTEQTLNVSKTLSKTREGFAVSTPKTKSSNRNIGVDPKTLRILKRWQLRQKEFLFANRVKGCDIIFADINGTHTERQSLYQRSSRLAQKTGLPNIGTHGFRHSHASMLFEAGVSMKDAQERLGHSSIEMTMDIYTHVTKKSKEKTVKQLAKFASF
ncbi:hypothetical protein IGJ02_002520 [Enterococcus sp. DIV0724b]|uniref:site-specific integrase n=1 Tax=Enterococcus sp. DIV0724b TaxID=2774694 RepID=UPI003D2FAC7A